MRSGSSLATSAALLLTAAHAADAQVRVDLELSLLLDVSGSVDAAEYAIQRNAIANTFRDAGFFDSVIGQGRSIAVNYIEWAGASEQREAVAWRVINNQADASAFATTLLAGVRSFSTTTAAGNAINFAVNRLAANNITSPVQIIDVTGDGESNEGVDTATARDAALNSGVRQINGFAFGTRPSLISWYEQSIRGGEGSFVYSSLSHSPADGIRAKIIREISTNIPTPGPVALGIFAAATFAARRRR